MNTLMDGNFIMQSNLVVHLCGDEVQVCLGTRKVCYRPYEFDYPFAFIWFVTRALMSAGVKPCGVQSLGTYFRYWGWEIVDR